MSEKRMVRFTVQGILETSLPETHNATLIKHIENCIQHWLETVEIKGTHDIDFLNIKDATVTIVNPLASEIQKNCMDIINNLVLALKDVGLEAQQGMSDDHEFGELPAIITINNHKSHRYDFITTVGFCNYEQCYSLSIVGYKSNGDMITLKAYDGAFKYQHIATKMKTYFSKQ